MIPDSGRLIIRDKASPDHIIFIVIQRAFILNGHVHILKIAVFIPHKAECAFIHVRIFGCGCHLFDRLAACKGIRNDRKRLRGFKRDRFQCGAIRKRAAVNTGNPRTERDLLERGASAEAVICHIGQLARQPHAFQRCTAAECTGAEAGAAVRQLNGFQCGAARKCMIVDIAETLREDDLFQGCAVLEGSA